MIDVEHEEGAIALADPIERCCFCRTPTRWWTKLPDRTPGQQVACCQGCADSQAPADVPTKDQWCDREQALRLRSPASDARALAASLQPR
jgi:hypothetical protein